VEDAGFQQGEQFDTDAIGEWAHVSNGGRLGWLQDVAYLQVLVTLFTVALASALCIGLVSFILGHSKPQA
jgi:hypothetical protein